MKKPNGKDLLDTLIRLLAEQEGVNIEARTQAHSETAQADGAVGSEFGRLAGR